MAALALKTVPAYPLGIPVDGRPRYSMMPGMAAVYRWLVQNKPHGGTFSMSFREIGAKTGRPFSKVHDNVRGLVERGWLEGDGERYAFVEPIQHYRERHDAA